MRWDGIKDDKKVKLDRNMLSEVKASNIRFTRILLLLNLGKEVEVGCEIQEARIMTSCKTLVVSQLVGDMKS